MLSAELGVPADAELLTIWFSYRTTMGAVVHDSDFGANYWFGFPGRDIDGLEATVTPRPGPGVRPLRGEPRARRPRSKRSSVPFFLVADPGCTKHEVALAARRRGGLAAGDAPVVGVDRRAARRDRALQGLLLDRRPAADRRQRRRLVSRPRAGRRPPAASQRRRCSRPPRRGAEGKGVGWARLLAARSPTSGTGRGRRCGRGR